MSEMVSAQPRLLNPYLYLLSFAGGFNVMLLEMCGFRVLGTAFGSSIYVTGVLLALVMIALSVGYYLGGRFSQRFGTLEFLLGLLAGAAVYVAVVHLLLVEPLLDACYHLRASFDDVTLQHVVPVSLATLVLFGPPMVALSHVSPYLIKLLSASDAGQGAGRTAGNLMAVSNVGSIAGTTLPSFLLLPVLGVRTTLGIFLASLGLVVALGLVLGRRRVLAAAAATAAVAMAVGGPAAAHLLEKQDAALVFAGESLYGTVRVLRAQEDGGDERLEYMPSRDYVHSTVYPKAPLKDQFTTAYVNVGLARESRRYLVLGTALGGAVAAILAADPQAEVTGVEIDPLVVDLSLRLVPALQSPRVKMVVRDARLFLREDTSTYDYIVVDIFAGEQIPTHCITQEFFALARARLAEDGVMQMNTNLWDYQVLSGLEQPEPFVGVRHLHSALLHAGFASLFQSDFFGNGHLYAFKRPTELAGLREQLSRRALDTSADPHLRASWAVASLSLVTVPDARREVRPFTDAWVPDHQLHLKGYIDRYLASLLRAKESAGWKSQVEGASPDDLRMISVRHYAAAAASFSPSEPGFKSYLETKGGDFCHELLNWAARQHEDIHVPVARYVHTPVLERCAQLPAAEVPAGGAAPRLRRYAEAATLVDSNQGPQALPLLVALLGDGHVAGK